MNEDEILAILERHGYIELASPEEIEVALKELRTIPAGYPDADMRIRHYERMLSIGSEENCPCYLHFRVPTVLF